MGVTATPEQTLVSRAIEPFLFGAVQLKDVNCDRSIKAKTDAFGNSGTSSPPRSQTCAPMWSKWQCEATTCVTSSGATPQARRVRSSVKVCSMW